MFDKKDKKHIKPIVEITGNLCYELQKGFRAFVQETGGKGIMTSQVLEIRNETTEGVEFETLNTIYKLTYDVAQAAA